MEILAIALITELRVVRSGFVLSKPGHDTIAVEIKSKQQRINRSFLSRYPGSRMAIISRDNYWV